MPDLVALSASLTLTFEQPFHLGTGRADGLIHRTIRRTSSRDPYVPGSALKGAMRETAERIARRIDRRGQMLDVESSRHLGARRRGADVLSGDVCQAPRPQDMCQSHSPCVVCRLFGNAIAGSRLLISDARPQPTSEPEAHAQIESYTNVRIDRRRKGAAGHALFTSEYARPQTFAATINGQTTLTRVGDTAPIELVLLASTIAALDQIGAGASKGKGRCHAQIVPETLLVNGERVSPNELIQHIEDIADHLHLGDEPLSFG